MFFRVLTYVLVGFLIMTMPGAAASLERASWERYRLGDPYSLEKFGGCKDKSKIGFSEETHIILLRREIVALCSKSLDRMESGRFYFAGDAADKTTWRLYAMEISFTDDRNFIRTRRYEKQFKRARALQPFQRYNRNARCTVWDFGHVVNDVAVVRSFRHPDLYKDYAVTLIFMRTYNSHELRNKGIDLSVGMCGKAMSQNWDGINR